MPKEDFIQAEGVVTEALPNAMFRIELLDTNEIILGHLSGKMRKNFIKVLPGDRVLFDMSPYDLSKGRITRRLKPGEEGIKKTEAPVVETPVEGEATPEEVKSEE